MRLSRRSRLRHRYARYLRLEDVASICLLLLLATALITVVRYAQAEPLNSSRERHFADDRIAYQPAPAGAAPALAALPEPERSIASIKATWHEHWELGVAIATCESTLRPDAHNTANLDGSEDVGLFQINSIHGQPTAQMLDPIANAQFAYQLFVRDGTAPWESSRACWGA